MISLGFLLRFIIKTMKRLLPKILLISIFIFNTLILSAQSIVVDDFSDDPALSITSSFSAAQFTIGAEEEEISSGAILGGKRHMFGSYQGEQVAVSFESSAGNGIFSSQSQSSTPNALSGVVLTYNGGSAYTGLGGLDVTNHGALNAFLIQNNRSAPLSIIVYSDQNNSSKASCTMGANYITFESFSVDQGTGADFSNVGSIELKITGFSLPSPGGSEANATIDIDEILITKNLTATLSDALLTDNNSNGIVDFGDNLRYTATINNPDDDYNSSESSVQFNLNPDVNTNLTVGTVTTTQGTVNTGNTAGDTQISVDIGTINDNSSVTITFDVEIGDGSLSVSNQGNIISNSLDFVTDDPDNSNSDYNDVTITAIDPGATPTILENSGISVDEGAMHTILTTELKATDADTDDATLLFTITTGPSAGWMEYVDNEGVAINSFIQRDLNDNKIAYIHDDSNTTSDSFVFTVSDNFNDLTGQTFTIIVNPINDDIPTVWNKRYLKLDEGATETITTDDLEFRDTDTEDSELTFTVTDIPDNGVLKLSETVISVDETFTQQDINDNKITYVHSGSNTEEDIFKFILSDGVNEMSEENYIISIAAINDEVPIIALSQSFTIDEDIENEAEVGSVVATDLDGTTSFQNWTITSNVNDDGDENNAFAIHATTGQITVNDADDIDYETNTSLTIELTVSDGLYTSNPENVTISINNVEETGINNALQENVKIYPNPASNYVKIESVNLTGASIQLSDISGKTIFTIKADQNTEILNIGSLKAGVYFVHIQTKSSGTVIKLIKE